MLAQSLKLSTPAPVHNWMGNRLAYTRCLYARTCIQRCRVVGLRGPHKSDGSPDRTRVGHKRTSMDVGAVSIRRDPTYCHVTYKYKVTIHADLSQTRMNINVSCCARKRISQAGTRWTSSGVVKSRPSSLKGLNS